MPYRKNATVKNFPNQHNDLVFVDAHYAVMTNPGFKVLFTPTDKLCYDHFFYLDTPAEMNLQWLDNNMDISPGDLNAWKEYERQALSTACESLGKELIFLDEDTANCVQFMASWVTQYSRKYDYKNIAYTLVEEFIKQHDQDHYTNVLLMDCDNTFATHDATHDFCDFLNSPRSKLRDIFGGYRYSSYQFFKVAKLYRQFNPDDITAAIDFAASKINLSPHVCRLIKHQKNTHVIALTAGLLEVWATKIRTLPDVDAIFGNSLKPGQPYLVTPAFKKYVAQAFKAKGFTITAIGDSIIDIPMLEASHQAYIVAHSKINPTTQQYFENNPQTKIMQIFAHQWVYPVQQYAMEG